MAGITMLGLFLLLITTISLAPIYAEPMSPLQQISNGMSSDMIQCSAGKMLVQSQNAKPACVYEDTANKLEIRGWKIIQTEPIIPLDVESDVLDDFKSEIITIQSLPILESSEIGSFGPDPSCLFQNEITLDVPNRVKVGEVFDVVATFSFEDSKYDEESWSRFCNTWIDIRYPPNYQATGDELVQASTFVHTGFIPPTVSHGMYILHIEYNQQPITFQMKIIELDDAVYDNGAHVYSYHSSIFDISLLSDEDKYDYGHFSVARTNGDVRASVYTSINDGFVYLSDTEFPSGQSENEPIFYENSFYGNRTADEWDSSSISYDVPFEWIVEELEGAFKGEDPATFIMRFGLNQTYVDEFLEAYPEYKIKTQSSSLVKAIF